MSSSKNVSEQCIQAIDQIELALSSTIPMTRLRISEIIQKQLPGWRENFFIESPNAFLFLLLHLRISQNIHMLSRRELSSDDRYEEGKSEPILYEDIHEDELRTTLNERAFYQGFSQGEDYKKINDRLMASCAQEILPIKQDLMVNSVYRETVFYRRIDTPRPKKTRSLPALPATLT